MVQTRFGLRLIFAAACLSACSSGPLASAPKDLTPVGSPVRPLTATGQVVSLRLPYSIAPGFATSPVNAIETPNGWSNFSCYVEARNFSTTVRTVSADGCYVLADSPTIPRGTASLFDVPLLNFPSMSATDFTLRCSGQVAFDMTPYWMVDFVSFLFVYRDYLALGSNPVPAGRCTATDPAPSTGSTSASWSCTARAQATSGQSSYDLTGTGSSYAQAYANLEQQCQTAAACSAPSCQQH